MGFKSFANKAVLEFLPAGNFGSGKEAKGILLLSVPMAVENPMLPTQSNGRWGSSP